MLVHVGVRVLYRAGAIPGSIYAGPGSDATGIDALLAVVKDQPKDRDIVLYCGCCPAVNCPNMKPAFAAMREAGFTNVKALWIEKNFDTDWVNHGYPTEKPSL
jgi:thiosulfate/3-mercaptopyruvate sulfurtransferase